MLGARDKYRCLPSAAAEIVAEELGLLLELEEEHRLAAARKADLEFLSRMHGLLRASENTNLILGQIAESCTRGEAVGGVGAAFALIGEVKNGHQRTAGSFAKVRDHLLVRAQSGDPTWEYSVNGGSLEGLWRECIENGQIITVEANSLPVAKTLSKIVAIPLRLQTKITGVLLAGLPARRANLDILDRLELRGTLASEVMWQESDAAGRKASDESGNMAGDSANLQIAEKTSSQPIQGFEMFQQAIDWLEEGVIVFDEQGKVLAQNAMFQELLGLHEQPSEVEFDGLVQPASANASDASGFAEEWRKLAQNCEEGTQQELNMERPQPRTIERYARAILGPSGRKLGRVEVYRAIPGWRALQTKMQQTERLASLGQNVMQTAHELNNPLTTIMGNAQRLLQRESDRRTTEAAQILSEAERARGIVRRLLNLSRETLGERELISLNEVVETALEVQRTVLGGTRVTLKTELEETLPAIRGDGGELEQILLNLLQNAQQAIQDAGGAGTITVRTGKTDKRRVRLEVEDDGPGIPRGIQATIFDPFFTTKPAGKGTGLGLAIVLGFVRKHDGQIEVISPIRGGGTRFVVEFPAVPGASQQHESESVRGLAAAAEPHRLSLDENSGALLGGVDGKEGAGSGG